MISEKSKVPRVIKAPGQVIKTPGGKWDFVVFSEKIKVELDNRFSVAGLLLKIYANRKWSRLF